MVGYSKHGAGTYTRSGTQNMGRVLTHGRVLNTRGGYLHTVGYLTHGVGTNHVWRASNMQDYTQHKERALNL